MSLKKKIFIFLTTLNLLWAGTTFAVECEKKADCCTQESCTTHCTLAFLPDTSASIEAPSTIKFDVPIYGAVHCVPIDLAVYPQTQFDSEHFYRYNPQSCWDIQNRYIKLQC